MKKTIPVVTMEQLCGCEHTSQANVDIRRLESHLLTINPRSFPHRHKFFNLVYIKSGTGTHTIDSQTYEIKTGQMFFLNEQIVHEWDFSKDTQGYTLFFKREFYEVLEKSLSLHYLPFFSGKNIPYLQWEDEDLTAIESLFEEMVTENSQSLSFKESLIKSYLKIILIKALRKYTPEETDKATDISKSKIESFEELLEQHFCTIKAVNEYADMLNISANYLNVLCTKTTSLNAGALIRNRILVEAKRLLLHSPLSVCEIAYHLGYENCSYFIRLFKKGVGKTPEGFRIDRV